jgi:hypothetical protein
LATWTELQAKFHELHLSEKPHAHLSVWLIRSGLLPPRFEFRAGPPSPYFQQNYIQIATYAGLLLGNIPEGIKPVEFWLDRLVTFCRTERKPYLGTATGSPDDSAYSQVLNSVCEASATYCAWLDVNAIEESTLGMEGELHRAVVAAVATVMGSESAETIGQTLISSPIVKTISEQLDNAALLEDISHEEQAERIGISRSMYFEVKAGRGGRKVKAKAMLYLSRIESGA